MRTPNRNIKHRQAIDRDAEILEIVGNQPGAEPHREFGLGVRQGPEARCRWIKAPGRRSEPSHAPAFLVDQDRRIAAADCAAQCRHQLADLVRRAAVAPEQDEPDRIGSREEAAFAGAQLFPGAAENDRARCPGASGRRFSGQ